MKLLPDMARQFAGLVQGLLLQAIHWAAATVEATVCSESTSPASGKLMPSAVLVYACGMRAFEQTHLRECLDGFVRALPSREEVAPLGVDYGECATVSVCLCCMRKCVYVNGSVCVTV